MKGFFFATIDDLVKKFFSKLFMSLSDRTKTYRSNYLCPTTFYFIPVNSQEEMEETVFVRRICDFVAGTSVYNCS